MPVSHPVGARQEVATMLSYTTVGARQEVAVTHRNECVTRDAHHALQGVQGERCPVASRKKAYGAEQRRRMCYHCTRTPGVAIKVTEDNYD